MEAAILFSIFFALIMLGVPLAVCLGGSVALTISLFSGMPAPALLAKQAVMGAFSFPLIAVPLFILAGEIMQSGGLSARLISVARHLVRGTAGALCHVNVLACMFFAAISGSGPATVAAIGRTVIPEMVREKYTIEFSAALTASAGIIGVLIPPSIPMIVYGITSGQSISDLFIAGIIPGVLVGVSLMLYCAWRAYKKTCFVADEKTTTVQPNDDTPAPAIILKGHSLWALLIPVIILGGIYGGIFTPTEAAAVTVIYSLVVSLFIYQEIKWGDLPDIILRSAGTACSVLVLVVLAAAFSRLLTLLQVPAMLGELISSISQDKLVILLLINLILLLVGMFMDTTAAILVLTPIFLPVITHLGVNPVHFGTIMIVNLAIGFCTPPMGVNLFVASSVSGIKIERVVQAILPFLVVLLICLCLVTYVPALSLILL